MAKKKKKKNTLQIVESVSIQRSVKVKVKKDKDILKNNAAKTRYVDIVALRSMKEGKGIDKDDVNFFAERDLKTAWEVVLEMNVEGFDIENWPAVIKIPKNKFDNVVPESFPNRKDPENVTYTWRTYRDVLHSWFEYGNMIYFTSNTYGVDWTMAMLEAAIAKTTDKIEILSQKEFVTYKATQETVI